MARRGIPGLYFDDHHVAAAFRAISAPIHPASAALLSVPDKSADCDGADLGGPDREANDQGAQLSFCDLPGLASAEQPVLDGKNGRIDLAAREAFGRGARPWGGANAMVLPASDYASYLTGEVISVSGQHP